MFKMKKFMTVAASAIMAVSAMAVNVNALVNAREEWSIKPVNTPQSLYDGGFVMIGTG